MLDIVILTPSFNREKTLPKLYESLKKQTYGNFKWLIVDDGSVDSTNALVKDMIKENKIDITYLYQINGGKSRALNKGFSHYKNDCVFIIVDSDDYLLPMGVEKVKTYLLKYSDDQEIGAFFFHYSTSEGDILKPKGEIIKKDHKMTPYEYNKKFMKHDGCICYLKKVTEKYNFPEFKEENYLGPTVLQLEMSHEFKIIYSPEVIGVAEYQDNGLTRSGRRLRLKNPLGMIYYANLMMRPRGSLNTQIKYAISIWPYAKIANKTYSDILKITKRPFLLAISYLPGQVLYMYWKRYIK